jgi:hypothetical protein
MRIATSSTERELIAGGEDSSQQMLVIAQAQPVICNDNDQLHLDIHFLRVILTIFLADFSRTFEDFN